MRDSYLTFQIITYAITLLIFFAVWGKKYHVKESVSGKTLMKLAPAGRRAMEIQVFTIIFFLWLGFFIFRVGEKLGAEMFSGPRGQALMVHVALLLGGAILMSMLPIKVCENGLVSQRGYYPWEDLRAYSFKGNGVLELVKKSGMSETFYFPEGQQRELEVLLKELVPLDRVDISPEHGKTFA